MSGATISEDRRAAGTAYGGAIGRGKKGMGGVRGLCCTHVSEFVATDVAIALNLSPFELLSACRESQHVLPHFYPLPPLRGALGTPPAAETAAEKVGAAGGPACARRGPWWQRVSTTTQTM